MLLSAPIAVGAGAVGAGAAGLPGAVPLGETVASVATPSPTPSAPPDALVTPQPVGFFATLFVAIAVALLGLDLVRRIRRINYRAQIRERLEAEAAELAEQHGAGSNADGDPER